MSLRVSGVARCRAVSTPTRWPSLPGYRHSHPSTKNRTIVAASASSPKKRSLDDFFATETVKQEYKKPDLPTGNFSKVFANEDVHQVQLTKTDAQFKEEGVEFVAGFQGLDLDELNQLFVDVRFPRRSKPRLRYALENTYSVLWIRYSNPTTRFVRQGQILGFARAISDGVFYANIWDVAVLPSWQRIGLGRGLMERLLQKLTSDGIQIITLYAEREVVGLYRKLGFSTSKGTVGMAYTYGDD